MWRMTNDPDVQEAVQDEVESPRSARRSTLMNEEGVSAVESKSQVIDKQQAAVDKPLGSPGKVLS